MFDIIIEQSPQSRMARWLLKQQCRKLRECKWQIANGTWRYKHGVLEFEKAKLAELIHNYKRIQGLYDKKPSIIIQPRIKPYLYDEE